MSSRIFTQDTTALALIHNYEPTSGYAVGIR